MKAKKFSEALGNVRDEYVSEAIAYQSKEAEPMKKTGKKITWQKWAAMAACLCLVVVGAFNVLNNLHHNPIEKPVSAYIQEDVKIATIYHTLQNKTTELVVEGQELAELRDWTNNLAYTLTANNGKAVPDNIEDGEKFEVVLEEGDYSGFSYFIVDVDKCYLHIGNYWYEVSNPSYPPISDIFGRE